MAYPIAPGAEVIGEPTQDNRVRNKPIDSILDTMPDLIIDNEGDIFSRWLARLFAQLRGGNEETTTGRIRLSLIRVRLIMPILVINDSPIKQLAENRHAVGQSTIESLLRKTNRAPNGRRVEIFGYRGVVRGVLSIQRAHAYVSVIEVDPVLRLEAMCDVFMLREQSSALDSADIDATVEATGDVVTATDFPVLSESVILINMGNLPLEIDVSGIALDPPVASFGTPDAGISTFAMHDGRRINLLSDAHKVNLAGPRTQGESIKSMNRWFCL